MVGVGRDDADCVRRPSASTRATATDRYSVYATDVAGNAQARVASNKLKVK